jgi:hypothetical protein
MVRAGHRGADRPWSLRESYKGWFAQATSYWETDAGLREFCGCDPA